MIIVLGSTLNEQSSSLLDCRWYLGVMQVNLYLGVMQLNLKKTTVLDKYKYCETVAVRISKAVKG